MKTRMKMLALCCTVLLLATSLLTGCNSGVAIDNQTGLQYKINPDQKTCTIVGIGNFEGVDLEIPESINGYAVTDIGESAFWCNETLNSVRLPNALKQIGNKAFYQCAKLTIINLPDHLESIGSYAFYSCSAIQSISIPEKISVVGDHAFMYCDNLESVDFPAGLRVIDTGAFAWCVKLSEISLPGNIENIEMNAFMACSALKKINYKGTMEEWVDVVEKGYQWDDRTGNYTVQCQDGLILDRTITPPVID